VTAFGPAATHVSGRRLFAHWIDGILIALLAYALALPLGALLDTDPFDWLSVLLVLLLSIPYFVLLQRRDGRSPGKRLCGIRVVDADGRVPSTAALVRRSVPLLLEWISVFALIGILTSERRQRFGDRWAGTYVVDGVIDPSQAGRRGAAAAPVRR